MRNLKKNYSSKKSIFLLAVYTLLALWLCISVLRTFYNASRAFYQLNPTHRQTDYSGSITDADRALEKKLQAKAGVKDILLLNESGTISYHYLRYRLYPKRVYNKPQQIEFDAIVVFGQNKDLVANAKSYRHRETIIVNNTIKGYLYTR